MQHLKRVNFNMSPECHALLKGVCALKGVTVSDYVHKLIVEDFHEMSLSNNQVQQMFLNGSYPIGSKAYLLKEQLQKDLNV